MNKLWVIGIIILFVTMSIVPTSGYTTLNDDTTPPFTMFALNPPDPDGHAGWYVHDVDVTLNATDDLSGVKEIRYTVNGVLGTIPGDFGIFTLPDDGDDILVEYWSIDNAGNIEPKHSFTIDIDQTKPNISAKWEIFSVSCIWYVKFIITVTDNTSGIEVIRMYINEGFHQEIVGSGPVFEFTIEWPNVFMHLDFKFEAYDAAGNTNSVIINDDAIVFPSFPFIFGFICNPEITEENVTFFTLLVLSNYGGIHMFKHFAFPNDYIGYIGRFFISAKFCNWYDWPPIEV